MFTLKAAAARLALSKSKLYQMVEKMEIGHHRMGGAIRISEEQILEYLEKTRREPSQPRERKSRPHHLKHLRT